MSPSSPASAPLRIGVITAVSIIATNMVGTGVFTSLGFQLAGTDAVPAILMLWLLGGLMALCGAAVYGELGLVFPGSGGEYNFLSRIYHPMVGFVAGWLSATVGFAAPMALSAKALGAYLAKVFPTVHPTVAACVAILVVAAVHAKGMRLSLFFQNLVAAVVFGLIVALILAGGFMASPQTLAWHLDARAMQQIFSGPFAVSLVYVSYAYSGWNAVTYVAGELAQPKRTLPLSLFLGAALVTLLYVLLNLTFLRAAPAHELKGALEVAHISASHLFGGGGARLMSLVICAVLVGSLSGMSVAGARIVHVMAETYPACRPFLRKNAQGSPVVAMLFQALVALVLVLSGTFEAILTYLGFTLSLCTCLAVGGIFLVRKRRLHEGVTYRCWGYPVTPLLFLGLNLWMLVFVVRQRPLGSVLGLATLALGIPVYLWLRPKSLAPKGDAG